MSRTSWVILWVCLLGVNINRQYIPSTNGKRVMELTSENSPRSFGDKVPTRERSSRPSFVEDGLHHARKTGTHRRKNRRGLPIVQEWTERLRVPKLLTGYINRYH